MWFRSTFGALIIFLLGCAPKTAEQSEQGADLTSLSKIEKIQLKDLDGNPIKLEEFAGKRVFLNLWATWCKPCIAEMPAIDRAAQQLLDENYVFLAASDENMDRIKRFASKNPYSFKYVQLQNSVYDLEVIALPTTLIISSEGEIVYEMVGAKEWDNDNVLEELRRL